MERSFAYFILLLLAIKSGSTLRLLYSDRKNIRMLTTEQDFRSENSSVSIKDDVLVNNLDDVIAIGYHYEQQLLFWTDVSVERIVRKSLRNKSQPEAIISTGLVRPEGLAVDWITNKFYWTDSHSKLIEVANMDGSQRCVLFWSNVDQPRAIVVDPHHGFMFWSDWGEKPGIVRAGMDASNRMNIITDEIKWPNGLAIDYEDSRLFWLDAHNSHGYIASSDFNGHNRKKVIPGSLPHPFAISVYGERLYWTDWTTKSIHSCNKETGDGKWTVKDNINSLMDLRVFDAKTQVKVENPCGLNNGGCSHLCLLAPNKTYSCACPTGVVLLADTRTCEDGPQNFILIAKRTEIRLLSLDTPDYTAVILPIHDIRQAVVVEYDTVEGYVYWTDLELHVIKRARLNGSDEQVVVSGEIKAPEGIVVDWIARNLYWSDGETDRIEVCRLNGSSRKVLVSENLDEPRALVVDPKEGYLYWSDWGRNPRIERAWLDGTHRQVLVNSSIVWPNGLAIDYENRKIYWGDAKLDKIEVCDLNGSNRVVLANKELPHIYGFGLIGHHIFWTDWQRRNVQKVHIASGEKDIIIDVLPDVMGLKVVDVNLKYGANPCQINNGGCDNLCFFTPQGVKCDCPMGQELTKDNKTCAVPEAFLIFTRYGSLRRLAIDSSRGDKPIPIPGLAEINAVDFHINDSKVFWTDSKSGKISGAFLNGSEARVVIGTDVHYPDGLAVDWVANNLYWTDSDLDRIECTKIDGSFRKTLIWKNVTEPHSLVLDPRNGYMYWTNWGKRASINRAQMDGGDRQVILENHKYMARPSSLAIDFFENKLYWTEEHFNLILRSNMDGSDLEVVVGQELPHPNCLTQYKDYIYWGDMQEGMISRASKTNGENRTRVEGDLGLIMDMKLFHGSRQVGWNDCGTNNGGCSHLCLALPHNKYTCACPNHFTLDKNNKSCSAPKQFLLYSKDKQIRRLSLSNINDLDVILPLRISRTVTSLEYDVMRDTVFWIVEYNGQKDIYKSSSNGSNKIPVIGQQKEQFRSPLDLAYDPYGKQLYWTDSFERNIKVTHIDQGFTGILIDGGEHSTPRSIALDPERGFMYWTNFTGTIATIEKARMNGAREHKRPLMEMKLAKAEPGDLVADPNGEYLYFIEKRNGKIVKLSLKDLTYTDVNTISLLKPRTLAIDKDFIYVVDVGKRNLRRIHKKSNEDELLVNGGIADKTDVIVVDKRSYIANHPCSKSNGGCSHICSMKNGAAVCSCPKYNILADDGKTCEGPPTCDSPKFLCKSGECIHKIWLCDGASECEDESDEEGCPQCPAHKFTCDNKQCVEKRDKCDSMSYCTDESDLKVCKQCKEDEFHCSNDKCIPLNWKCDGVDDCDDNSDEFTKLCANVTYVASPAVPRNSDSADTRKIVIISVCVVTVVIIFCFIYFFKRNKRKPDENYATTYLSSTRPFSNESSLIEMSVGNHFITPGRTSEGRSLSLTSNPTDAGDEYYNREDLTGRSRSTVQPPYGMSLDNPPPSPVTLRSQYTSISEKFCPSPPPCHNHRQYRPAMPFYATQTSTTDIESSVSKYLLMRKPQSGAYSSGSSDCDSVEYDTDAPPPPPPTICTNYYSDMLQLSDTEERLPPSPTSEHCFTLEPDPPPPSPVTDSPSVA